MPRHMSIDIETYSSVDLKKAGLYKYAQSPDFEVLLFAYAYGDGIVQIVDLKRGERLPPQVLTDIFSPDVIKHAYNAPFEWYCLSRYFGIDEEKTPWLYQWRCTMLHGLYCGFTAGLGPTGEAMGISQDKRKLSSGLALIRLFCSPVKPSKANGGRTRNLPHHEPAKWDLFKTYCMQDVNAERAILHRLSAFPVPDQEQRLWETDQRINARGVAVDRALISGALFCSETVTAELLKEAVRISSLNNPKSVAQLSKWLDEEDEEVDNLQKETVTQLIKTTDNDKVRRMMEIRQELAKTSVKKYTAMDVAVCDDGRVRGLLQFYGANRTGRWAGRLVQVQNLPKNKMGTLAIARRYARDKNLAALRILYGNIPDTLSQLIRTAFIPSEGNTLMIADFSAIEARVIAWLAGESWRLEVFNTHGKIYEASAAAMFGVPLEKIVKGNSEYELRQRGKVAELALGYQGSVGAMRKMDLSHQLDDLTDEEVKDLVVRWRGSNKRIVDLWYRLENTALNVLQSSLAVGTDNLVFRREIDPANSMDFLTIQLPSGRKLFYAHPFMATNDKNREALHYYGTNQDTKKWGVIATYGGKLTENVVQAIARDCLAESLVRLERAGYKTVMHIHDEAVLDVPAVATDLDAACELMGQPIAWAPGLPLRADGFISEFYKKD